MERKILQIAAMPAGAGYTPSVLALAEDGTLWVAGLRGDQPTFGPWSRINDLPEPGSEQDKPAAGLYLPVSLASTRLNRIPLYAGFAMVAFGGVVGIIGNLLTGHNFGTSYAYVAGALMLIGAVVQIVRS